MGLQSEPGNRRRFRQFRRRRIQRFSLQRTSGAGVSMVNWASGSAVRILRRLHLLQANHSPSTNRRSSTVPVEIRVAPCAWPRVRTQFLHRSRVNPHPRVETGFQLQLLPRCSDIRSTLMGTGLLDKYLFQGFSAGGARRGVETNLAYRAHLGQSSGTGDVEDFSEPNVWITFGRVAILRTSRRCPLCEIR